MGLLVQSGPYQLHGHVKSKCNICSGGSGPSRLMYRHKQCSVARGILLVTAWIGQDVVADFVWGDGVKIRDVVGAYILSAHFSLLSS